MGMNVDESRGYDQTGSINCFVSFGISKIINSGNSITFDRYISPFRFDTLSVIHSTVEYDFVEHSVRSPLLTSSVFPIGFTTKNARAG